MGPVVGRILLRRPRALLLVILLAATATCARSTRTTAPSMAFLHLQRGREFRLATFRSGRRCSAPSPPGPDPRAPLPERTQRVAATPGAKRRQPELPPA